MIDGRATTLKASGFILRIVVAFDDVKSRRSHNFLAGRLIRVDSPPGGGACSRGRPEKPRRDCTPAIEGPKKNCWNRAAHVQGFAQECNIIVPSVDCRARSAGIWRAGNSKSRITWVSSNWGFPSRARVYIEGRRAVFSVSRKPAEVIAIYSNLSKLNNGLASGSPVLAVPVRRSNTREN